MIEVDPKGKEAIKEMGMQDVFDKEINKLKKRDETGNLKYEIHNMHFDEVDF